jgi:hypothetical protein
LKNSIDLPHELLRRRERIDRERLDQSPSGHGRAFHPARARRIGYPYAGHTLHQALNDVR